MLVSALLGLWLSLSLAEAAEGGLSLQVFTSSGMPATNATLTIVNVDNKEVSQTIVTDETGYVYLTLEEGSYTLSLEGMGTTDVTILSNQNSDVLFSATNMVDVSVPEEEQTVEIDEEAVLVQVTGQVSDSSGAPVENATIVVRGLDAEYQSDSSGQFAIELPEGAWDIVILKQGLTTRRLNGVEVVEGLAPLSVELRPKGVELADFIIGAPRIEGTSATLLAERKLSSSVNDVIGAEQMSRAGDSNAASALKRVTGLTVVGGKYVYVRGLGERYSASLLNGVSLPSPEPERRVVPARFISICHPSIDHHSKDILSG